MTQQILIVDPATVVSETLKTRLAGLPVEITHASSTEALDEILKNPFFDLVICEWALEDREGEALLQPLIDAEKPVYLFTERDDVVSAKDPWTSLGIKKAFSKLHRMDLVMDLKALLKNGNGDSHQFLLVEDSITVRNYLKRVLEESFPGSHVFESTDGREALRTLGTQRMDLIVTDLKMPGMDGESFIHVLKANAVLKSKPVLVFSGAITQKITDELQNMDNARILPKPAEPNEIVASVRAMLDASHA